MTDATRYAILNANYIKARLEPHYPVLYTRANGRVAHELIFDLRAFKAAGIEEMDVAKRLMDYGFHAPTVSFPVAGTLMVEPTESEDKARARSLLRRDDPDPRARSRRWSTGAADRQGQRAQERAAHRRGRRRRRRGRTRTRASRRRSRCRSCRANKFWPSVGRIDNPYGDRNLFCSCPPVESTPSAASGRDAS